MKTTYSFPLLCALDHNQRITDFCALDSNEFNSISNNLIIKIANRLNLAQSSLHHTDESDTNKFIKLLELNSSSSAIGIETTCNKIQFPYVITNGKYLIDNNIKREGKYLEMIRENVGYIGIGGTILDQKIIADIAIQYLIEEIETYVDPNSYIIIPKDVEITGVPQITGSFDRDTNTFSPAENLRIIPTNEWADSCPTTASITKPKPDETYIFNFEENEWSPDPELDYDLHGDGKPYRYNSEYKSWYPNWEPEPEPES